MTLARKIILHSPIANQELLEDFVEQCLRDGVSLLAIFGKGSTELEEQIDWLVIGEGDDPNRFLCTTSHADEAFEDVVSLAECWEMERNDPYQVVRL